MGDEGGSCSQEHSRMEIMKGDKGDKTAIANWSKPEWRSGMESNDSGTGQPRLHEGRQGGAGCTTILRFWRSTIHSVIEKEKPLSRLDIWGKGQFLK